VRALVRRALGAAYLVLVGAKALLPAEWTGGSGGSVWPYVSAAAAVVEFMLAVALLLAWRERAAAVVSLVLSLAFAAHLVVAGPAGISDCGCLGSARVPYAAQIILVAALLFASGWLLDLTSGEEPAAPPAGR
jgi:hypothetical protein